jgi:hypothetical protein
MTRSTGAGAAACRLPLRAGDLDPSDHRQRPGGGRAQSLLVKGGSTWKSAPASPTVVDIILINQNTRVTAGTLFSKGPAALTSLIAAPLASHGVLS